MLIKYKLDIKKKILGSAKPPKNSIDCTADPKIILLYSAKKNKANNIEPYSIL